MSISMGKFLYLLVMKLEQNDWSNMINPNLSKGDSDEVVYMRISCFLFVYSLKDEMQQC
jgi:hypothetical protein